MFQIKPQSVDVHDVYESCLLKKLNFVLLPPEYEESTCVRLFFCLSHILLGQYCQKCYQKWGVRKEDIKGGLP